MYFSHSFSNFETVTALFASGDQFKKQIDFTLVQCSAAKMQERKLVIYSLTCVHFRIRNRINNVPKKEGRL